MEPWEQPGYFHTQDMIMDLSGSGKSQAQLHWERGQSTAGAAKTGLSPMLLVGLIAAAFLLLRRK